MKGPCPDCNSSDACETYDDGHTYCFSCNSFHSGVGSGLQEVQSKHSGSVNFGEYRKFEITSIPNRGLTEETCRFWNYGIDSEGNHIANYGERNGLVAQKIRTPDKKFSIIGDVKQMGLYGSWLWKSGGKYLTVVEGEIDALTVSQINNHKWPVVSVPNGAAGAVKAVRENLEWVSSFDTVVFMFDMDDPGTKAAKLCSGLLKPGQAKIARLPAKDPNELLQSGRSGEIVSAFWKAETFRPDGILDGQGIRELLLNHKSLMPVAHFFTQRLDELTRGMRAGEIITVCAGTKVGKSEFVREIALKCLEDKLTVGYIALEESIPKTIYSLVGMKLNSVIKYEEEPQKTPGFWDAYADIEPRLFAYNHWGSSEEENLISKIRYLRIACECNVIILDHISMVISGIEGGDERRMFDNLMTKLRSLSEETGAVIVLISHLKRPATGTPLEEGGQTSLSLLRGSGSIGQLSDTVIGLERNQQDEERKNITTVRLLACRWTGESGTAGYLMYNKQTGRLLEISQEDVDNLTEQPAEEGRGF